MTQSNQISQDGVYVIGRDMKGGTWHITGPANVDLSGAYAVDISGGCTWVKIG